MDTLHSQVKLAVDYSQFSHTKLDLAYADQSPSQRLDLVYPEQGVGPFPLIVFIHGGGFVGGGKDDFTISFVFKLVSQGYAVASVEYRLALEAPWPAQIYDVKAAVRWLRANHAALNLDTEKLLICGNSAGATLTQLIAATGGKDILEDRSMGNARQSCKADAIISWYGLSDFEMELLNSPGLTHEDYARVTFMPIESFDGYPALLSPADLLLHTSAREQMERVKYMSPISYVDSSFPPSLFQHGLADPVLDYHQTTSMVDRVRSVCGEERAELDLFPDAVHGDPVIKADENMRRCLRFIRTHLPDGAPEESPMPEIRLINKTE